MWDISATTISVIQRIKRTLGFKMLNIHKDLLCVMNRTNKLDLYKIGPGYEALKFEEKVPIGISSLFIQDACLDVGGERREYIVFGIISTGALHLFSLQTRRVWVFKPGKSMRNKAIVISKWLAEVYSGGFDQTICGHSLRSNKRRLKIRTPSNRLNFFKIIKKGRFLLMASPNKYVSILNLLTLQIRSCVFSFSHHINSMICNTNESELVVGGDSIIHVRVFKLNDSLFK